MKNEIIKSFWLMQSERIQGSYLSQGRRLPVTQQPKAESHGEETIGECPTCHGKGEVDK